MNYTKGGWKVSEPMTFRSFGEELQSYFIQGASGYFSDRTIAEVGCWKDRPNAKEDAYLIASAPDMYEALKLMIERMHDYSYPIDFDLPKVLIEKALAKAEGK
jgi:hypothetical protein